MNHISYLKSLIENDEKKNAEDKVQKLKNAIDYFDEIINAKVPNRMILQMLIDKIYIDRAKIICFNLKTDIEKLYKI